MFVNHRFVSPLLALLLSSAASTVTADTVNFVRDIRPILNKECIACHGGVKQAGGVSFIIRERVMKPAKSGDIPIIPGKPGESVLIKRINSSDDDERMPPPEHGPKLTDREIKLLRDWVQQGAKWEEHWSFVPPKPQALPKVKNKRWPQQPLDYFILARLEKENLKPSAPADRVEWLRRVTLDLTGLPPTLAEIEAFKKDASPDAFEKVVDRLLESPRYGERWAALWLDLARYADSQGYEKDSPRTMWPYRDWLIRAFNSDMPYDQFTLEQIAGDLLPNATLDDRIGSGFNRNTPTNSEGGTDDEEFRVAAVIDRVNTTWKVWEGLTFGCVQCHSHPYDPIEHDDYYKFMAFYNTSQDWDLRSDDPRLAVPLNEKDFDRAQKLDVQLKNLEAAQLAGTETLARENKQWQPLTPAHAESTGETQLVVKKDPHGIAEVLTQGTVSHDSKFSLEFPVPERMTTLTALRVDALPVDPAKALYNPELGFTISQLRAQVITSETTTKIGEEKPVKKDAKKGASKVEPVAGEIAFAYAFGDELEPFDDPQSTLNPDKPGWGAQPRITHPRHLVVVPKTPVTLPKGATLRIVIRQENAPNDLAQLVMNRSHYSLTDNDAWTKLIAGEDFKARNARISQLKRERSGIKNAMMPVMAEQDPQVQRGTAVFVRGNWLSKSDPVTPAIPPLFPQPPAGAPANRLTLAKWMISKDNPLTARVAVNRCWEQLFGIGLVETLEDFGSSGAPPSHPELLDYLALRFQNELGWSMKKLLREMVLSAAYRQDSGVSPALREKDPRNRLLARGPRTRLSAEMIRDNALSVAGILSNKMYGPPVMPPQPDGIWRAARSKLKWVESKGDDRVRRAIYTYWRRSSGYPSLLTFDAPSRIVCTARRLTTNTPLQALVTLNDPVYMEAAKDMALRMRVEGGAEVRDQIARGYELASGRKPEEADLKDLLTLHDQALVQYQAQPALAEKLGGSPDVAALTLVANAILNLDVVLTK